MLAKKTVSVLAALAVASSCVSDASALQRQKLRKNWCSKSDDVMLQREVIMQDLERKHVDLVQNFGADLKLVLDIFRNLKDHPIIGRNMPPVAGSVLWVRGLKERIQDPYERFKSLHASAVMESEETKEVFKI